jgi:2-haloacid dehalogenase/putative hydrolase of the HAD superfamily
VPRPYDVITFDCYGTLIDWEGGITEAFAREAAADGVRIDAAHALREYARTEPLVEQERYRPYREVLAESAVRVARSLGWPIAYSRGVFLPDSLPRWKPFPDTNAALERLRNAGYRLGILSNVDDDLLAATRKHFTVDFEIVITAQQVRAYKPSLPHFLTARERIGTSRWLHAAQSNMHDILPTNSLVIPNAWVNRKREQPLIGGIPGRELANLEALADWLATRG